MSNVHQVAVSGFGEGTNDIYDQYRPTYPVQALDQIHKLISLSSPPSGPGQGRGWKIIEPGSGTGILSRLLICPPKPKPKPNALGYPSFNISTLVGVEPSKGMRDAFRRGFESVSTSDPSSLQGRTVGAVQGGFDDFVNVKEFGISKEEGVDAVIIAQAWHWCPDHEKALREIASYLPPSHPLILIWNLESYTPSWQAAIREAYQPYDLGTPQYYKGLWRDMFETVAYKELFEDKEEWKTEWSVGITEDQLINRLFSKSYLTPAHLTGEGRTKLESELRKIISGADHEWLNKEKGIFKYAYETDIVVLRRKA
ncbi:hypothetical protein IAR55_006549 [Kwoniella newhampshirensis]|uniref:Methyltransferase type 11 domain-containing protein n=1 Tax=Kwoniella newhampshirensis TaxID=1651941 RepID=A0AAW0YU05_9TREE